MRIRNRKINPTMVELIIGIVAYGILGTLLWVMLYMLSVPLEKFFDDSFLQIMIGFVIGIVFSIATIIHMTSSVETALEMGEHGALKHTRISYIVRMVALIVVFALMIIFDIGNIFAVLFGLCDAAKAKKILQSMEISRHGLVSIWPPFEGISSVEKPLRHNNLIWPFVNAFFAHMAAQNGRGDLLRGELLHMAELALNSEGFYEIYNAETGEPDGGWQIGIHWESIPDQTWSATGFIRMVVYALCGVELEEDGIWFRPCLPDGMGDICLKGLRIRGIEMDIVLHKNKEEGTRILINGEQKTKISYSEQGKYIVEVWFGLE